MPGHLVACVVGSIKELSVAGVVSVCVSGLQTQKRDLDEHVTVWRQFGFNKADEIIYGRCEVIAFDYGKRLIKLLVAWGMVERLVLAVYASI